MRLVGDPLPIRRGVPYGGGRGILTKREMEKVKELLQLAAGSRLVNVDLVGDDDTWTAFTSLLRGALVKEKPGNNLIYELTGKGKAYLDQVK